MTGRDLIELAGRSPAALITLFVLLPVVAGLLGFIHVRDAGRLAPWKYVNAVLVYLACVPGIAAAVLTAYTLFFTRENLLDQNLLVFLLPIISMAATLVLIRKNVAFEDVPGFDRLSGLMVLIGVSFAVVLAISKTFIGILFGGSIFLLLAIWAALFALLKWGSYTLFRRKDEPRQPPPGFPAS